MAASRAARKREMIANLENGAYIKALVDEAYCESVTELLGGGLHSG